MHKPSLLSYFLVACVVFGWLGAPVEQARAQGAVAASPLDYLPALKGGYFKHASESVGRDFHIYVRLPEGYDKHPEKRYPVVYVLDGDSLFPMLAPMHLFLTYDEEFPEAVVVGIAYGSFDDSINKRRVDFSAATEEERARTQQPNGAPAFLGFLQDELMPTIESRYRVDPARRVLVGQSRAGYFVLWSAVQAPDLFWGRIASNPSSSPGRERLFAEAAAHQKSDLSVVVAVGDREVEFSRRFVREWAETWQSRPDVPWRIQQLVIENGTHAASIGAVYRQAMRWLFLEHHGQAGASRGH